MLKEAASWAALCLPAMKNDDIFNTGHFSVTRSAIIPDEYTDHRIHESTACGVVQ